MVGVFVCVGAGSSSCDFIIVVCGAALSMCNVLPIEACFFARVSMAAALFAAMRDFWDGVSGAILVVIYVLVGRVRVGVVGSLLSRSLMAARRFLAISSI